MEKVYGVIFFNLVVVDLGWGVSYCYGIIKLGVVVNVVGGEVDLVGVGLGICMYRSLLGVVLIVIECL